MGVFGTSHHSFEDGGYRRYFAPPPPPPFPRNLPFLLGHHAGLRGGEASPQAPTDDGSQYSPRRHGPMDRLSLFPEPRVLLLHAPPTSAAASPASSPRSVAPVSPPRSAAPPAAAAPLWSAARLDVDTADEEQWETVLGSSRCRRKEKARAKRDACKAAVRKTSARLALKEQAEHVTILTRACKLRALKDALKGCTATLQSHVNKEKILDAVKKPLGMKPASQLGSAAFGAAAMVNFGADV
nr:uncharacterized protein LOC127327991 [Lolium perenne]